MRPKAEQFLAALLCVLLFGSLPNAALADGSTEAAIAAVKSVGHFGRGHRRAQQALAELRRADRSVLLPLLRGMNDANPLARNWLLNAFEVVAERELKAGRGLPKSELEGFVLDRRNAPEVRRVAFEWLVRVDPTARQRLLPDMLRDPSAEMRRDAVARLLERAKRLQAEGRSADAVRTYQKALTGATDDDQVQEIVQRLKQLGQKVDLQRHFGFVVDWHYIGPFDNHNGIGFDAVYPPEREFRLDATYPGKLGPVRWQTIHTDDDYGWLDIAKQVAPYKGAVLYLAADFCSDRPRQVELRLATQNAFKVWLNGRLLLARLEYHRGRFFDQYRIPCRLKAGRNRILVKLCQNEQTESWAQEYGLQLRVVDPAGLAVHSRPESCGKGDKESK